MSPALLPTAPGIEPGGSLVQTVKDAPNAHRDLKLDNADSPANVTSASAQRDAQHHPDFYDIVEDLHGPSVCQRCGVVHPPHDNREDARKLAEVAKGRPSPLNEPPRLTFDTALTHGVSPALVALARWGEEGRS